MISLYVQTAETKQKELAILAAQREQARLVYESQRGERIEQFVEYVFNRIKRSIDKTEYSHATTLITLDDLKNLNVKDSNEFREAVRIVIELLNTAGYTHIYHHEYSSSWQTRSGKFMEISINITG